MGIINKENTLLLKKYSFTSLWYDLLDYYWERQYKKWRPQLVGDVRGAALEAGIGTGRNLPYYRTDVEVTGIDLSPGMLRFARKRMKKACCPVNLFQEDATLLTDIPSDHFDWYISTFMFCVMPDHLQPLAIEQMARVLKKDGRFRIIEMVYSKDPKLLWKQKIFAPFVEKVYGARFDRNTLSYIQNNDRLDVTTIKFLKADTYLFIEGLKVKES